MPADAGPGSQRTVSSSAYARTVNDSQYCDVAVHTRPIHASSRLVSGGEHGAGQRGPRPDPAVEEDPQFGVQRDEDHLVHGAQGSSGRHRPGGPLQERATAIPATVETTGPVEKATVAAVSGQRMPAAIDASATGEA